MPTVRKYRVQPGLQQMLKLGLIHVITDDLSRWQVEVEQGELSEQARQVFVALGWITQRDVRVTVVNSAVSAPTVRAKPPKPDEVGTAPLLSSVSPLRAPTVTASTAEEGSK